MDQNLDSYREFDALSSARQEQLLQWIRGNLSPIQSFNPRHTSYGLKHLVDLGSSEDSYFTNGQFKGAMRAAGYRVRNKLEQNWVFNVSERSPILVSKKRQ